MKHISYFSLPKKDVYINTHDALYTNFHPTSSNPTSLKLSGPQQSPPQQPLCLLSLIYLVTGFKPPLDINL